jgi:hypothetical protein
MGKTGLILIGACAAALAACAPADPAITPAEADNAGGAEDAVCAADDFAYLIGQSRAEAAAANLPEPYRIYGEGDAVTMDYSPRRLNVVVGEGEIVTEVKCG